MSLIHFDENQEIAYNIAKNRAGWFVDDNAGIITCKGVDAVDFLQRMTTNEMKNMSKSDQRGLGVQTVLVTDKARIIDIMTVLHRQETLQIILTSETQNQVIEHCNKYAVIDDVEFNDNSADFLLMYFFGVESASILHELTGETVWNFKLAEWCDTQMFGQPISIVKFPPICELCYGVLIPRASKEQILRNLRAISGHIAEISADIFDTLRIESGNGVIGKEYTLSYNPLEAGLISKVNFKKGCYLGQEVIARLDSYNKVKQKLIGLQTQLPVEIGQRIFREDEEIGVITSTCFSPELDQFLSLSYIRTLHAIPDTQCEIRSSNNVIKALISKLPFTV